MGSARISIVPCASRSAKSAMPGEKPSRLVALSDSLTKIAQGRPKLQDWAQHFD
jgi:hypothetical protein